MSDKVQPRCNQHGGYRRARRDIEAVAARLDECLRDQALSGQGWDGLASLWRSAEKEMDDVDHYFTWYECDDEEYEEHQALLHEWLLAVAATLLDLSSHIESMRRSE